MTLTLEQILAAHKEHGPDAFEELAKAHGSVEAINSLAREMLRGTIECGSTIAQFRPAVYGLSNRDREKHLIEGIPTLTTVCLFCKKHYAAHRKPEEHPFISRRDLQNSREIRPEEIRRGDFVICDTHGGEYPTLLVIKLEV